MRFLVDECTGTRLADWLKKEGYEVFSVYEQARGSTDEDIIKKAFKENWILITNDKDFGEKVYRDKYPHRGIIFMRLQLQLKPLLHNIRNFWLFNIKKIRYFLLF
jgi:predicted nuclease of predicted toxin-antitoxin system